MEKPSAQLTILPTTPHTVPWQQVVANEKKEVINAWATALHKAEGVNSCSDHLYFFTRAQEELCNSLSEAEVKYYQDKAKAESQCQKAPPTPDVIFKYVNSTWFPLIELRLFTVSFSQQWLC